MQFKNNNTNEIFWEIIKSIISEIPDNNSRISSTDASEYLNLPIFSKTSLRKRAKKGYLSYDVDAKHKKFHYQEIEILKKITKLQQAFYDAGALQNKNERERDVIYVLPAKIKKKNQDKDNSYYALVNLINDPQVKNFCESVWSTNS